MVKKIYVILYVIFLCFVSSAYADHTDPIAVYDFDQDPATQDLIDQVGNNDSTSDQVQAEVPGLNGNAWDLENTASDNIQLTPIIDGLSEFCFVGWVKFETYGNEDYILSTKTNAVNSDYFGYVQTRTTGQGRWNIATGATTQYGCDGTIGNVFASMTGYNMVWLSYDGSRMYGGVNKTTACDVSASGTVRQKDFTTFGGVLGGSQTFDGEFDEFYFYDHNCSQADLTALHDGYFYGGPAPGPVSTPAFSFPTPNDNAINITQPTINVSHNGTDVRYNLYVDGVVKHDNVTQNATGYLLWTADFTEGKHNYTAFVQNTTSGLFSNNITRNFTYDISTPLLSDNFTNQTAIIGNLQGTFNFSDNIGLHTVNISIDGDSIFYITNIQNTTLNYTLNYDTSALTPGWHTLTSYWSDGHTATELRKPYDFSNGLFNDYSRYEFDGSFIKTYNKVGSIFDTWTTERKIDRYTQIYQPSTPSDTHTFIEESDKPIYIINTPGFYGGTWIILADKWKDYVLIDEPDAVVNIKRINNYKVEVTITGIKNNLNELRFNSIGDLNIQTKTYNFFVGSAVTSYDGAVRETVEQTIYLNMTKGAGVTTNANLLYNGTGKTSTKAEFTDYDIYTATFNTPGISQLNKTLNFTWNFNLSGPVGTESGTVNASQFVYKHYLDNCSNFTTYALNVSVINFTTGKSVTSNIIISAEGSADYYNTITAQNFSLCIYPNYENLTESISLQYDDGTNTYYYNTDLSLTNSTQFLTLYTQSTSDVTTFTIKNKNTGATIEGAYATMYRLLSGVWTEIESKFSDITGRAQFNFNSEVEYRFLISHVNYEAYTFNLNPIIFDSYDILMTPTATINSSTDYDKIALYYEPRVYYDGESNNFTFNIHSPYDELTGYSYTLTYPGGSVTKSGTNPAGEQLDAQINITGATVNDKVLLNYYYITDLAGTREFSESFEIIFSGNNTIFNNRNETYGLGLFERLFIAVFFVLLTVGIGTLVGQPIPGMGLGLILYGYFVYIGFLPIWTVLITLLIGIIYLGGRPDG